MRRKVFLEADVVEWLLRAAPSRRRLFWSRFREMADAPERFSDFTKSDETGRLLDVHVYLNFAIVFRDDFSDRHLKILDIKPADRA